MDTKEIIKSIIYRYSRYNTTIYFIEHKIGNNDIVLATLYGDTDEELTVDYETILENTTSIKESKEIQQYLKEIGIFAEIVVEKT